MGIERMNAADDVATQYATTDNLAARMQVWGPDDDGVYPQDLALQTIVDADPSTYLEVGCGTGAFARRVMDALPRCRVDALDFSSAMVAAAQSRGVTASVGDIQDLPQADDSVDAMAALWMLYHVPDVDRGIAEMRRVLKPGGVAVVITNGEQHLADLKAELGLRPTRLPFSNENGPDLLRRHFEHVDVRILRTRATFHDASQLHGYLASMDMDTDAVDAFTFPRVYRGDTSVMTCR